MQIFGFREFSTDCEGKLGSSTGRVAFAAETTLPPAAEGCRWVRENEAHADNMLTARARKEGYIIGRVVTRS